MKRTFISTSLKTNSVKDIFDMINGAKEAQKQWNSFSLDTRIQYLKRVAAYIAEHADDIAQTISHNTGKTLTDAMATEVLPCVLAVRYYCKNAKKFLKDKDISCGSVLFKNKESVLRSVPYGVIGIIAPWNYPFAIPFSEVIMALLAGNAVILKPAGETEDVGNILKNCFDAAGFPEHVFNYTNSLGSLTGDAFIDGGVDKLFFTGSVKVGKYLMKQASKKLIPLVLELGGNDPMIVCEDADLERAAAGALWGGFSNAGQSCCGVERIYVHDSVYNDFLRILKDRVEALRIGSGASFDTDVGPVTLERQFKKINEHVRDALRKGARIYAEASVPDSLKGLFMPCLVLTSVNHDMLIMKEETFGPVVAVMPYRDEWEAIELANDSSLGLTASVWSKNRAKAKAIASRIKAGTVTINDHLMSHGIPSAPWGGFKESGIGRTHGEIGFMEMVQPQLVVDDVMPFGKRNFFWFPNSKKTYDGLRGAVILLYGEGLIKRLAGLKKLLAAFTGTFKRV